MYSNNMKSYIRKWQSLSKELLLKEIKLYDQFIDRALDKGFEYQDLIKARAIAVDVYAKRFPDTAFNDLTTRYIN